MVYSRRALRDLDRLGAFLTRTDSNAAAAAVEVILDGVQILERHPWVGRPVRGPLRELVLSFGATGYVALYRVAKGRVEVLSIRYQREAGY